MFKNVFSTLTGNKASKGTGRQENPASQIANSPFVNTKTESSLSSRVSRFGSTTGISSKPSISNSNKIKYSPDSDKDDSEDIDEYQDNKFIIKYV